MSDKIASWTPPPRPEWVQRINDEAECMNIRGVVPLDEASLLNAAMQTTGLTDFGTDEWREPFRILVKSMEDDAALNLMGRIRTRSELLQLLEARLLIEDTYKRHPEIADEKIEAPIIILGQGRSGTSFLINLLSQLPGNGAILHWEAMFPCPPPEQATYHTDPRIARGHKAIDQWNRVTPTITAMHEFAGHLPMEDCQVLALTFMAPSWFGSLGQTAAYDAYMLGVQYDAALQYHKRVLKLLQWKNPRQRWVLKDPTHIDKIEAVLRVYPDARLVWPHRDPLKALASTLDLLATIQWGRSDFPLKGGSFEYVLDPDLSAARLNNFIDKIETGVVPRAQLYNLLYHDLVRDPAGVAEAIYTHFEIPFDAATRQSVESYMAANPREARPSHKFGNATPATTATARAAFKRYQETFNIPSET